VLTETLEAFYRGDSIRVRTVTPRRDGFSACANVDTAQITTERFCKLWGLEETH